MSCPEYLKVWYSIKFELPVASFLKYICSFFLPKILLLVSCCNVLYVTILLSRLFLRSKSVGKCSMSQSFIWTNVSSYRIGTLLAHNNNQYESQKFVYFYFEYFYQLKSFTQDKDTPKNASVTVYTKNFYLVKILKSK